MPSPACILLDVEGTTTSISFVYDVLFPYAREHAAEFLRRHGTSRPVQEILASLGRQRDQDAQQGLTPPPLGGEASAPAELEYLSWLMDRDSKATPLKTLQGQIWEEGYREGRLQSHVFPDVPAAFRRWRQQSRAIAIFSSGSVLAQKQLFAHTVSGDLTSFIDAYFDTTTGAKQVVASYTAIARQLHRTVSEIIFVSDVTAELDAASAAGLTPVLCLRPGNRPQPANAYRSIHTFDEIA